MSQPRLHHINFSRPGPAAIGIILRQHPQGRPKPLATGEFGGELEQAIRLRKVVLRIDAGTGDVISVDDCSQIESALVTLRLFEFVV